MRSAAFTYPSSGRVGWIRGLLAQEKAYAGCARIAPLMLADFHPLTPYSRQLDRWIAWQFNRPERGDGVVQAFRRSECGESRLTFHLNGLNPASRYELTNFDLAGRTVNSGAELTSDGLTVVGTAELHPSKAAPWKGTTIIQAKHTNGYNRKFSDSDFYSKDSKKTVLGQEMPRVKKLREAKKLDHYMLFSNRRLGGNTESAIRDHISSSCGIPAESIYLCGVEQLEVWMKHFPDVPKKADLDPVDSPLLVSPDDLAEVVEAIARQRQNFTKLIVQPPTPRTSYEKKNSINNMTADYAKELRKRYLKETKQIGAFLAAPENMDLLQKYESVSEESDAQTN